jgi:hypothetical protein
MRRRDRKIADVERDDLGQAQRGVEFEQEDRPIPDVVDPAAAKGDDGIAQQRDRPSRLCLTQISRRAS